MRTTNKTLARTLLPAISRLGGVLLIVTAVNSLATMTRIAPHIGDMIAFDTTEYQPPEGARLIVHRPDQFGCVLDVGTLRKSGGSLIIEREISETAGSFLVHWAGERTSADTGNCGEEADLILDSRELKILALGAGSIGGSVESPDDAPPPFVR